jgi:hypothetical protein
VKIEFRLGTTQRPVVAAEIDLKHAHFHMHRRLRLRIILEGLLFVPLAGLAFYFGQPIGAILAIAFGAFLTHWQFLAFGFTGGRITPAQLDATRIYPKAVLIVLAIFWSALISFVCVALYLKFPDS